MDIRLHHHPYRAAPAKPVQTVMVWDLPLRLFHWAMVGVVAVAGVTGFLAPEWWLDVHVLAGYALATLLVFRAVWGFAGSTYSKFRSFPLKSDGVFHHLRSLLHKKSPDHVGHNPLGAWMIVILLVVLVTLVISGLVVLGGQENLGPLAFVTTFSMGKIAEDIHEIAAWALVGAVVVHLLGVSVETRLFHHPVLSAMITGKKKIAGSGPESDTISCSRRGAVLFLAVTVALVTGGMVLSSIPPAGWRAVETPKNYIGECGDCHDAYHPSLRTGGAWRVIMAGLAGHYGEDATLDEETAKAVESYLRTNPAETFDTEIAHRLGRIETASLRMTDTPYWKKRHRDIDPTVFRKPAIGSKVNCRACHQDAASGRFDDSKIHLPTGDQK